MNQIDEGQSEGQAEINPGLTGMNNFAVDAPINMNTNTGPFDKSFRHNLRHEELTPSKTGLGDPIGDAKYLVNRKQSDMYRHEDASSFRNQILGYEEEMYPSNRISRDRNSVPLNDIEAME